MTRLPLSTSYNRHPQEQHWVKILKFLREWCNLLEWFSTHLSQETIFTLCSTYPNSEVVYVNKGTSPSAGNKIHLMQDVSKFRGGLHKQRLHFPVPVSPVSFRGWECGQSNEKSETFSTCSNSFCLHLCHSPIGSAIPSAKQLFVAEFCSFMHA